MPGLLSRYARWLHTRWPAGTVEKLPEVNPDGSTRMPGVYLSGDLTGIPLLKFSLDSGARVAQVVAADPSLRAGEAPAGTLDLAIVGAGVSGMAAAVEARRLGLSFAVVEAAEPFFTLVNFPKGKPIYTYPRAMVPAGELQVRAEVKEALVEELRAQVRAAGIEVGPGRAERVERVFGLLHVLLEGGTRLIARRVLIAIGRSGSFRRLGVPGEDLDKVYNRLHDPKDFAGKRALVVGGGDTALETAIALTQAGAEVTIVHRGAEFSRPKPENVEMMLALMANPMAEVAIEHPTSELVTSTTDPALPRYHRPGQLTVRMESRVLSVAPNEVVIGLPGNAFELVPNDVVFVMIGREAPLGFFRRSKLPIAGEMTPARWTALAAFVAFCAWLYNWKSGGSMWKLWERNHWFPANLADLLATAGGAVATAARDPHTLLGTLAISASGPSFYYTFAYSIVIVIFGIRRIRRRRTPYVTAQTLTLMAVQVFPLFLIPEIILPQLEYHGLLPRGLADALFPVVSYGHGREFWRAYGLILAWPLNVYNIFTDQPLWWWIGIGFVQTCVLIPLGIWFFGKGVYCGWICSCGALAETLGDTHRHKMPHGPGWNRLNLAGQGVLAIALVLLVLRIIGWAGPHDNWIARNFYSAFQERYKWYVDVFLAGVLGYGVYFWYSGRVWCRFFCPLAALMHVYARFSRFAIIADKKKCISCSQCTTACHQGIDVMSFANKGAPMRDPECVRCSACVETCPTGVLSFGQVNRAGQIISIDSLLASPVQMREK
jgi:thioredoxin reductase/NAD-dependent dihydropyrimidine dehydrogenase PreA subunit